MNPDYASVAERASHRCEYCGAPEAVFNFPFEVEHILPPGQGGTGKDSNLALSCRSCNVFKGSQIGAVDPETGETVPLFNPRRDHWKEHFKLNKANGILTGLTPVGRATMNLLQMNSAAQLEARRQWMRVKLFP